MSVTSRVVIATAALCVAVPIAANADTFTTLHTFTGGTDGSLPDTPLVYHRGALYGTTSSGGSGKGNIFKIGATTGKFDSIYAFGGGVDGSFPLNGIIYQNGLLYGTTGGGGGSGCVFNGQPSGCGTIFSFDPTTHAETVLYEFSQDPNAVAPEPGQLLYLAGTLYGTTTGGGANGYGSVFSFNILNSTFVTLHSFAGGADGATPNPTLSYKNGVLYGSTIAGGKGCPGFGGCGLIFSIDLASGTEAVVRTFGPNKGGRFPDSNLICYANSLIGDTYIGGDRQNYRRGEGVSFLINAETGHEKVLDTFVTSGQRYSGLTLVGDSVYETLPSGGSGNGELDQFNVKTHQQAELYQFTGGAGGAGPMAPLTYDNGAIYGTTYNGGNRGCFQNRGCGTIFKYVP